MNLDEAFIEEFGTLSQEIQNNALQGKIQMFFRLIKKKVTQNELAETFGVKNNDIDSAMENFKILNVAEETEENGLIVYTFRGYSSEMKEIVKLFPERKKKLEIAVERLERIVEKAREEGQNVDKYIGVIRDIKRDFGI